MKHTTRLHSPSYLFFLILSLGLASVPRRVSSVNPRPASQGVPGIYFGAATGKIIVSLANVWLAKQQDSPKVRKLRKLLIMAEGACGVLQEATGSFHAGIPGAQMVRVATELAKAGARFEMAVKREKSADAQVAIQQAAQSAGQQNSPENGQISDQPSSNQQGSEQNNQSGNLSNSFLPISGSSFSGKNIASSVRIVSSLMEYFASLVSLLGAENFNVDVACAEKPEMQGGEPDVQAERANFSRYTGSASFIEAIRSGAKLSSLLADYYPVKPKEWGLVGGAAAALSGGLLAHDIFKACTFSSRYLPPLGDDDGGGGPPPGNGGGGGLLGNSNSGAGVPDPFFPNDPPNDSDVGSSSSGSEPNSPRRPYGRPEPQNRGGNRYQQPGRNNPANAPLARRNSDDLFGGSREPARRGNFPPGASNYRGRDQEPDPNNWLDNPAGGGGQSGSVSDDQDNSQVASPPKDYAEFSQMVGGGDEDTLAYLLCVQYLHLNKDRIDTENYVGMLGRKFNWQDLPEGKKLKDDAGGDIDDSLNSSRGSGDGSDGEKKREEEEKKFVDLFRRRSPSYLENKKVLYYSQSVYGQPVSTVGGHTYSRLNDECVVCRGDGILFDREKVVMMPCGHCLCSEDCVTGLAYPKKCPECSKQFTTYRLFDARRFKRDNYSVKSQPVEPIVVSPVEPAEDKPAQEETPSPGGEARGMGQRQFCHVASDSKKIF